MTELLSESRFHKTLNGSAMAMLRDKKGLSQQQLATEVAKHLDRCSISQQFIAQLEGPGESKDWCHEVPADIAMAVKHVLNLDRG